MTTQQLFEQIAREQHAMIKRIASSHEAEAHLVEDLVQDIYFAVWRALPSFRGDSSVRTFVARIATNRAVTHVARALKTPPFTRTERAHSGARRQSGEPGDRARPQRQAGVGGAVPAAGLPPDRHARRSKG